MIETLVLWLIGLGLLGGAIVCILAALTLFQLYRVCIKRRWVRRPLLPPVAAYTSSPSFTVGERVPVHVHTVRPAVATLLRLGAEAEKVSWSQTLPALPQNRRYDVWRGPAWPVALTLDTGGLRPGMYLLQLEHADDPSVSFRLAFLLSPAQPADVAVVLATNTWQAYNTFGGLSNYQDRVTPLPLRWIVAVLKALNWHLRLGARHYFPCVPLPEARPNLQLDADFRSLAACPCDVPSHVGRADWAFLRFLERERVPYGVFSDRDLAFDPRPTAAKLLIFAAHSEYWSCEMAAHYTDYLHKGGKALFVSGNNAYQTVLFHDRALVVTDFRAEAAETARLTGLVYDGRGYATYAGFRVCNPEHWVFAGLGVQQGDVFAASPGGNGGSGWETDKLHPAAGPVTVLAVGLNSEGPAFLVIRENRQGGWVVNTGSVASASWVVQDPVLGGIVRNVIARALRGAIPGTACNFANATPVCENDYSHGEGSL